MQRSSATIACPLGCGYQEHAMSGQSPVVSDSSSLPVADASFLPLSARSHARQRVVHRVAWLTCAPAGCSWPPAV